MLQSGSVFAFVGGIGLRVERVELPWVWVAPSYPDQNAGIWRRVDIHPEFEPTQLPAVLFADLHTLAFDTRESFSRPERMVFPAKLKQTEEEFKQSIRDWLASPQSVEDYEPPERPLDMRFFQKV